MKTEQMTASKMIELLSKCNPDAPVTISIRDYKSKRHPSDVLPVEYVPEYWYETVNQFQRGANIVIKLPGRSSITKRP